MDLSAGVNHGFDFGDRRVLVMSGACLSRMLDRVELKQLTMSTRASEGEVISSEADRSERKSWMLIKLIRRNDRVIGGGTGLGGVSKRVRSA